MQFDISKIEFSQKDRERNIKLPKKPTPKLAEFIGILAGDGYVNFKDSDENLICIAGDSNLDKDYLNRYVGNIFKDLFNISPKCQIRKGQNSMYIGIRSKAIVSFLKLIGFYKNRRVINVPSWIQISNKYMKYFVKGLADTDFSLMIYDNRKLKPPYPIIGIASISKDLVKVLNKWLIKNGFNVNLTIDEAKYDKRTNKSYIIDRIKLNGRKNLEIWMKKIGFRNKRHLNKYEKYFLI